MKLTTKIETFVAHFGEMGSRWGFNRTVGHENRRAIYNLYHALNHVVLFGLLYVSLVDECVDQIAL